MQITVTGRHLDITPAIRDYASEKALKLPRYFDRVLSIEVVAAKGNERNLEVEMLANVEHREPFIARAVGQDLYALIDEAVDKLERQLTDHKERLRNRKHNT